MALVIRGFGEEDFDEEAVDRDEFEIEQLLSEFVDEPSIHHDQMAESDDDEEKSQKTPREKTHIRRGEGRLYKNQTFFNGMAFKECVLDYALRTCQNVKQQRYDRYKIAFKCVGGDREGVGCTWKIYASSLPKDPLWKVRIFEDKHSCVPNGQCEMLKVPHIARLFLDKIRDEPEYFFPMKIEETVLEKWGITVSRNQCQAARKTTLRWIECEYGHQFARLREYAAELIDSNKESTVVIDTLTNEEGKEEFNRFYVCFNAIKTTWKETCRPLIGVDGTFLKHKMKGQLLVALGRDANNRIYPIAWAVVQAENTENWCWFVKKLKDDLGLNDGDGFIMISDKQKGLITTVQLELSKIDHRMCVRPIYANLKKNHGSKKDMKPLIWSLAWSYNNAEYEQRLDRIRCYDIGVYNDVQKTNPKSWVRAFHKLGNYCEDVENNSTESFNNTIRKAREKPFVSMLEMVRRLAMARIAKRSAISHDHKGICTPYVMGFLASEKKKADECIVTTGTNGDYEARLSGCSYRVNLEKRTCSCLKFQICGIPCEHAYGVIIHRKKVPKDYVCHWFRTTMWKRNYTDGLVPVRGVPFWPSTYAPNVHIPPEPLQPGRKKITKADKKRKKCVNKSPTKKQDKVKKRIMHCGICGTADHNSRFHKKPSQADAPSQALSEAAAPSRGLSQAAALSEAVAPSQAPSRGLSQGESQASQPTSQWQQSQASQGEPYQSKLFPWITWED